MKVIEQLDVVFESIEDMEEFLNIGDKAENQTEVNFGSDMTDEEALEFIGLGENK